MHEALHSLSAGEEMTAKSLLSAECSLRISTRYSTYTSTKFLSSLGNICVLVLTAVSSVRLSGLKQSFVPCCSKDAYERQTDDFWRLLVKHPRSVIWPKPSAEAGPQSGSLSNSARLKQRSHRLSLRSATTASQRANRDKLSIGGTQRCV
ncbi:hypothetical protein AOLI_G00066460 [Acnodon oligacanthus]